MLKNGDLKLDVNNEITGTRLLEEMGKFGIDGKIRDNTVSDNFGGLPGLLKTINPFAMDVIRSPSRLAPRDTHVIEHFRSTGIREGGGAHAYDFGKQQCNPGSERWNKHSVRCFANVWDHEEGSNPMHECMARQCVFSNDVNEAQRPRGCSAQDAGFEKCHSALYDSIDNLRKVFGTPPGSEATISDADWKALWLDGKYPAHFRRHRR
jgi:hypothetical protein